MNSLYFKSWKASDADRKDFMSGRNFEAKYVFEIKPIPPVAALYSMQ